MSDFSDWTSESLLDKLWECLPVYLSNGIDEPGLVDEKTALIFTPALLEELLTRIEECHNELYCDVLKLPRGSTYAQITDLLKNSDITEVTFLSSLIGGIQAYKGTQQVDISQLSHLERIKHQQRLGENRQAIQTLAQIAGINLMAIAA